MLVEADEKLAGIDELFDNACTAIVALLTGDFPTAVPREHPMSPDLPQEELVDLLARLRGARP